MSGEREQRKTLQPETNLSLSPGPTEEALLGDQLEVLALALQIMVQVEVQLAL